jgi:hypothetical protein
MKHEALPEGATVIRWEMLPPPPDAETGERFPWRETWGKGEWENEPDRIEWRSPGSALPRMMVRNRFGAWCGYVGLPPGHPLHGRTAWGMGGTDEQKDERLDGISVHWGVTYTNECSGEICHVPQPGEPEHVWWIGFDTAHAGDLSPGLAATVRRVCGPSRYGRHDVYRDAGYVIRETEGLARQLEEVGGQ